MFQFILTPALRLFSRHAFFPHNNVLIKHVNT